MATIFFCGLNVFDISCKSETVDNSLSEYLADPSNGLQTFGSKRRQISYIS